MVGTLGILARRWFEVWERMGTLVLLAGTAIQVLVSTLFVAHEARALSAVETMTSFLRTREEKAR